MVKVNEELCLGCKKCVKACPIGAIVLKEGEKYPTAHERRKCFECFHCAAICPAKAIEFEGIDTEALYKNPGENELEKLVCNRRSVRNFTDEEPTKEMISHAIDVAGYAPNAKNIKTHKWSVVLGREQVKKLENLCYDLSEKNEMFTEVLKLKAKGKNLLTCDAPVLIVIYSPDAADNNIQNDSIALTTLELVLANMGIGTCWAGYLRRISDAFPEVREFLNIEEGYHVRGILMAGFPGEEKYINEIYHEKEKVSWI